jgi:hypothetical protein
MMNIFKLEIYSTKHLFIIDMYKDCTVPPTSSDGAAIELRAWYLQGNKTIGSRTSIESSKLKAHQNLERERIQDLMK